MNCRICHSETVKVLDFGSLPLANSLEPPEAKKYPLIAYRCTLCNLIQLEDLVPPSEMFSNYLYATGASEPMKKHFDEYAKDTIKNYNLTNNDTVLDVGSNDGTLLKAFQRRGVKVIGVDPAKNLTTDVPTVQGFFDEKMAKDLGKFSAVTANNVLSHVADLHGFIRAVSMSLDPNGLFLFEVPWVVSLMRKTAFDLFYHEHLTYFGFKSLSHLLGKYDLGLTGLLPFPDIHGGSFRGIAVKATTGNFLTPFEDEEHLPHLSQEFAENVPKIASGLRRVLKSYKGQGFKIAGYGAPAKATILLNYCRIGKALIDWTRDTTLMKQGKQIPGTGIPIVTPEYAEKNPPDFYLLFAWNYEKEILAKEKDFQHRFIIPFPEPHFA